ncbi:MAG: histidine phosphatase family protein [Gammaproteobacteria bacterium]|nr:histidine phosphatase family protein [Gammaproteobacteria bacterium]
MNIHIIRHGQTSYNVLGLCNDNPARHVYLTMEGIAQAERAAKQLSAVPFEVIFVSQLPRTRQTARFINDYHKVRIIECEELNDIRSGFDGKPVEEYFAATGRDRFNIVPPGGESLRQFQRRINAFIDVLLMEVYENILIVAHEETMRVFAARFNGLTLREVESLAFGNCEHLSFQVDNRLKHSA